MRPSRRASPLPSRQNSEQPAQRFGRLATNDVVWWHIVQIEIAISNS